MKNLNHYFFILLMFVFSCYSQAQNDYNGNNFDISNASVVHDEDLGLTIWSIRVAGSAGATVPKPAGQLNGAPVLGYVFPTSLSSLDVGFGDTPGIVALALTSHPDFDDTPLWDENSDQVFDNDGIIWHPHWVLLVKDDRVAGGLAVKQFDPNDQNIVLPPTNPGMPMYMDSPGFQVTTNANKIQVVIPDYRLNHQTAFGFDAVTAFMRVNTEDENKPLLGVYEVYDVLSGDLSLPYTVKNVNLSY